MIGTMAREEPVRSDLDGAGPIRSDVQRDAPPPGRPDAPRPLPPPAPRRAERPERPGELPLWRRGLAWAIAVLGLPLLTVALDLRREQIELSSALLVYLLVVVATAGLGGMAPSVASAVAAFLLANWFFADPIQTWTIEEPHNLLAVTVFLVVAVVVSRFMATAAHRSAQAKRATAEAETLVRLAGSLTEADPLPDLVEHLRAAFDLDGTAVLRRDADGWSTDAAAGDDPPARPEDAVLVHPLGPNLVLALNGRDLGVEDRRILGAYTAQLGAAVERRHLAAQAARAETLAQTDELRSALLQAVSHDLRTPLAGIKASASSLRQHDVTWPPSQTEEFLATIEHETDRLTGLVENLLDMSRIQAGALPVSMQHVGLEEIVPGALAPLGPRARLVEVDLPETLPEVQADPLLLERVVANLVDNALAHTTGDRSVRIEGRRQDGQVVLRVVDCGPGIDPEARERVFQPFQRLGDGHRTTGAGVGLGLAVARGFARAIGGEIVIEETPGGGATLLVELQAAPSRPATGGAPVPVAKGGTPGRVTEDGTPARVAKGGTPARVAKDGTPARVVESGTA
jgi:two-component system sensor histidine kinase KdpD